MAAKDFHGLFMGCAAAWPPKHKAGLQSLLAMLPLLSVGLQQLATKFRHTKFSCGSCY